MVKGTPLAALLDPGAPAQRAGVISSLNMVADCLELLPEWEEARQDFCDSRVVHRAQAMGVSDLQLPTTARRFLPLHSVWLDLFILRMMGYCEDHAAKPVWFVLDELASLNKLPQLHTAVTENRKYGNPVVLGFQGRSQLEKRYGQDAEAMLSQPATKVFFKTSEPRAAKWISDAIGEIEVERLKESRSMGLLRQQEVVCDGDRHQAARHGLGNLRAGTVARLHQAGESRCAGSLRAGEESRRTTGFHRAQNAEGHTQAGTHHAGVAGTRGAAEKAGGGPGRSPAFPRARREAQRGFRLG